MVSTTEEGSIIWFCRWKPQFRLNFNELRIRLACSKVLQGTSNTLFVKYPFSTESYDPRVTIILNISENRGETRLKSPRIFFQAAFWVSRTSGGWQPQTQGLSGSIWEDFRTALSKQLDDSKSGWVSHVRCLFSKCRVDLYDTFFNFPMLGR